MHDERSSGNQQDLICMGSMAIFKNWVPNIEFLENQLRICGKNHILQKKLFIILSSIEMISNSRMFAIINIDVLCLFFG